MTHERWFDKCQPYRELEEADILQELRRYESILEHFCEISKIDKNRVEVNVQTFKDLITRVDMREMYFQVFHAGMQINEYKFAALECYWIVKLHPIWMKIMDDDSEETMQLASCINEKFALHILCMTLERLKKDFFTNGRDLCKTYYRELEYSFRFRDLSKESMYLMMDPFYYMGLFEASVTTTGQSKV